MATRREHRWIIVAEDGRHVTLGRDTDPSDEEVARAGEGLRAQGLGGWLAVLEGSYYRPQDALTLLMVRTVAPSAGPSWEDAKTAFLDIRSDTTCAA